VLELEIQNSYNYNKSPQQSQLASQNLNEDYGGHV
jgi:hypothetical protein